MPDCTASYLTPVDFRPSDGIDVDRGVDVAVVDRPTLRARPFPNAQRLLAVSMSARRANLTARIPAADLDESPPIPSRLVFKLSHEFAPTRVRNRLGKTAVLLQSNYVQILDRDRLVFTDDAGRELVQEIFARICNLGVEARKLPPCPVSIVASFLFATQCPLIPSKLRFVLAENLWRFDLFAIASDGEVAQPKVDADGLVVDWQERFVFLSLESHKVPSGSVLTDREAVDLLRQRTRLDEGKRLIRLGDEQHSSLDTEGIAHEPDRLLVVLRLESRVLAAFGEEVAERPVLVAECLLQGDVRHVVEPREFLLDLGELGCGLRVVDTSAVQGILLAAPVKNVVPHKASAPERLRQQLRLRVCRVSPVFVGALNHERILQNRLSFVKYSFGVRAILPRPKALGLPRPESSNDHHSQPVCSLF